MPRGAVTRVEAVDITVEYGTCRVGELTNLEPCDGVQNLMQAGWDQQTVDETEDTCPHCARRHDPLTACMNGMLYRRPDITKDSGQNQTEKACRNRNKAFSAKEAQEIWQFDTRPTVVHCTADQTGNNTRQNTHVDFRVDGYHRFGQDEITDCPCQRRGTRADL